MTRYDEIIDYIVNACEHSSIYLDTKDFGLCKSISLDIISGKVRFIGNHPRLPRVKETIAGWNADDFKYIEQAKNDGILIYCEAHESDNLDVYTITLLNHDFDNSIVH